MTFNYLQFKKDLANRYSEHLSKKDVEEALTFEDGYLDDKAPTKRLVVKRISFKGEKAIASQSEPFSFDKVLGKGLHMIMADNLKGKSSIFKIIKLALTGDNDIAVDVKRWIKSIHLEFSINEDVYTAYINLEKFQLRGSLYKLPMDNLIDKEVDPALRLFNCDSGIIYKATIQNFFFTQFQFYHLNWTQKSSQKDKNELLEAKASWTTYYESIYLTSRASSTLAFGNQEELIFQMLLGLKLTYPINRIKTRLEMAQFDLAKLRDLTSFEVARKNKESKTLVKEYEKIQKELNKLKDITGDISDISEVYEKRDAVVNDMNVINSSLAENENTILQLKRNISTVQNTNYDLTAGGNRYKELIRKAEKSKIGLQEYVDFGIFFSNLDIKICPHCNTAVSKERKLHEKEAKECMLCTHHIDEGPNTAGKDIFLQKIQSLDLEIQGYNKQLNALRDTFKGNRATLEENRKRITETESEGKILRANTKALSKDLKEIETTLQKAKQQSGAEQRILELEKQSAVLEYRINSLKNEETPSDNNEIATSEAKIQMLAEALDILKKIRSTQNEEIINNFKELLLEELNDLGINGISEVALNESFKISYNLNENWVTFDKISEGEQLRIKIAFYLSIIQLDIKYNAGKHPRLLIIDSPNKEEGDKVYVEGLKKLLTNISKRYKDDLQIIIGTASRELDGAVPASNTITFPEGTYLF